MSNEKWKCPKCGIENDIENAFCGECGTKKPERELGIATAGKAVQKQINPEPTPSEEIIPKKESKKKNNKGMIFTLLAVIGIIILVAIELHYQAEERKEQNQQAIKKAREIHQEYVRRHQCESEDRLFPCTDNSTGFFWSNLSSKEMNWNDAKQYCENLTEGNFDDWRLPTISELKTTIKNCQSGGSSCRVSDSCLSLKLCWSESCHCNYIEHNGGYYSKLGDDDKVWLLSSSLQSDDDYAWGASFDDGTVRNVNKSYNYYVRCVR